MSQLGAMMSCPRSTLVLLFCIPTTLYVLAPQRGGGAGVMFQAATHKELVEGDLDGAVRIYQVILDQHGSDRSVAAEAVVRLGACHEKLGTDGAQDSYRRVIEDYGDQAEAVRKARERLKLLLEGKEPDSPPQPPTAPRYRPVLNEGLLVRSVFIFAAQFDFSPDGSEFVFVSTTDGRPLKVSDSTGTLIRSLEADFGEWRRCYLPRWSPDGRSIAYVARRKNSEGEPEQAVFTLSPKGAGLRQVGPAFPLGLEDLCWSPDSQHLTYVHVNGQHQVGSLLVATGEKEILERLPTGEGIRFGGYSPDGRWLSCSLGRSADRRRSEIWILPSGGGRALQLTDAPGFDGHPTWSLDGQALCFISDRGGDHNLWKLQVDPKTGQREGKPKQITFFREATVRHPRLVGNGEQMAFLIQRQTREVWVEKSEDPRAAKLVARGKHARISPDGGVLYYIAEGPNRAAGIFALSLEDGASKHLTEQDPLSEFDLTRDVATLAYHVTDADGRGLYTLSTAGGEPLLRMRLPEGRMNWAPRWSPDGTKLAYTQNGGLFLLAVDGGRVHATGTALQMGAI